MKAKKISEIGATAMVILETVFNRFTSLLKGESILDFLLRIGGLSDISLVSLVNIAFIALFSFLKRVRLQPCVGYVKSSNSHILNRSIFLHFHEGKTIDPVN
jgi:hypothetical protein